MVVVIALWKWVYNRRKYTHTSRLVSVHKLFPSYDKFGPILILQLRTESTLAAS